MNADGTIEFENIPFINIEGELYPSNICTLKMLGAMHGYYPTEINTQEDEDEGFKNAYQIDSILEYNADLMKHIWQTMLTNDKHHPSQISHMDEPMSHDELKKDLLGVLMPRYFIVLTGMLESN